MDDLSNLGTGGGVFAGVVALAIAAKYLTQAWGTWRKDRSATAHTPMTDAATTNAMLLDSLKEERAENGRKDKRIDQLETEVEKLRDAQFELRKQYEEQLDDMRGKLADLTAQLDRMQQQIRTSSTEPPAYQ